MTKEVRAEKGLCRASQAPSINVFEATAGSTHDLDTIKYNTAKSNGYNTLTINT